MTDQPFKDKNVYSDKTKAQGKYAKEYYTKTRKSVFRTHVRVVFEGYIDIEDIYREDAEEKAIQSIVISNPECSSLLGEDEGFIKVKVNPSPKKITFTKTRRIR